MTSEDMFSVMVHGLPKNVTSPNDLMKYFNEYGEVIDIFIPLRKDSRHQNRGYAFIRFTNRKDQESCVKSYRKSFNSYKLMTVHFYSNDGR